MGTVPTGSSPARCSACSSRPATPAIVHVGPYPAVAPPQQRPLARRRPGSVRAARSGCASRAGRGGGAGRRAAAASGEPPVAEQRADRRLDRADHRGHRAGDGDEAERRARWRRRRSGPRWPAAANHHCGRSSCEMTRSRLLIVWTSRSGAAAGARRAAGAVASAPPALDGRCRRGRCRPPGAPGSARPSRRSRSARGLVDGQERQRRLGLGRADHLEPQLGQPEERGPAAAGPARPTAAAPAGWPGYAARQQALVDAQLPADHVVAGDQPAHHRPDQHQHGDRRRRPGASAACPGSGSPARRWRRPPARRAGPPRSSGRERVQPAARLDPGGLEPVTGPPPGPRRARPAGRAAGPPPPAAGRGSSRRVAAAAVCSCTVASPNSRSIGPAVTSTNCIRP